MSQTSRWPMGSRSLIRHGAITMFLTSVGLYLAFLYRMSASEASLIPRGSGNFSQVTDFAQNDASGPRMFTYVPSNLASENPAIVMALHWCSANALAIHNGTDWGKSYKQHADDYGFIMVYPESAHKSGCWDVSSPASLSHDGGGDSSSLANILSFAVKKFNADTSRVFVMGTSSGAMMVNVLAATHPDVFTAGIVYSGVPAGCFYTGTVAGWNDTCSHGNITQTQSQWAQNVYDMYPGYSGARPKLQIHHGGLDNIAYPTNYNETIKQWTGVFGYKETPTQTIFDYPNSNYSKLIYGPSVEGIWANELDHFMPVLVEEDLRFFGIIK